jgi:hypothetical protein
MTERLSMMKFNHENSGGDRDAEWKALKRVGVPPRDPKNCLRFYQMFQRER